MQDINSNKAFLPFAFLPDVTGTKYFLRSTQKPYQWIWVDSNYSNVFIVDESSVFGAVFKHDYQLIKDTQPIIFSERVNKLKELSQTFF